MDPTGGLGLYAIFAMVIGIIALWIFAPTAWAIGLSIALAAVVLGGLIYIISNAHYT